jgi:CO/xanthine dehydrogenase FAD-binding subunit
MPAYLRPPSLDEALNYLREGQRVVLAGGTDFYAARIDRPVEEDVLDVTAIAGLRGIDVASDHVRIGGATTWSDLIEGPLPAHCEALRQAAREVGGVQIQNAGTIAGNLCNASPAADGVPVLLALDATVELASAAGHRIMPIAEFIVGARLTQLAAGELVIAILIPHRSQRARSCFLKLGARRYLVISIAMVAACIDVDENGIVTHCAVAVGACSAVARRLPALEARLIGMPIGAEIPDAVVASDLAPLTPIDDVRGTASYRREAAIELIKRALRGCCDE